MARAMWSGAISFGLVTVPVKMYSATTDHSIRFHQFERGTSDRIRYRKVNERTGKEVDQSDIVKGYPLDGDEHVIVEPGELDEIAPGRSRTIDIDAFVDIDEVDPVYFSNSYWLTPAKDEYARAYGLLVRALAEQEKAGIARLVMRGREYLAAIRAGENLLLLDTMRFAEDVRDPAEELGSLPKPAEPKSKEIDMAVQLIESMSAKWDPQDYPDTYTERVQELIESKRKGKSVVTEAEPPGPTEVTDLFDALSRSVRSQREGNSGEPGQELSGLSKSQLESMARELGVRGRSKMTRDELESAVREAGRAEQKRAS